MFVTRYALPALALSLMVGNAAHAQQTFDVVSIKRNTSNQAWSTIASFQDGHFQAKNITIRQRLGIAYKRDIGFVLDGPGWLDTDHYDIEAKTDVRPSPELSFLAQTLLRDRFQLQARLETRPVQIFALTRVRDSSDLRSVQTRDCPEGDRPSPGCGGFQFVDTGLDAQNVYMAGFSQWLTRMLGRFVVDQTNMAGRYDFKLPLNFERGPGGNLIGEMNSILSGLSDLGLKLETTRLPLEAVVVEKIDRPSDN